jgi:heterotetrameric sarcosine oxidase delta subunit
MQIPCPMCGQRDAQEFSYLGDATVARPQTPVGAVLDDAVMDAWHDYVYLRTNAAEGHREFWYHAAGCRQWLIVTRDLRSHEISGAKLARDALPQEAAE